MDSTLKKLAATILETLQQDFHDVRLAEVRLEPDVDSEGDEVLRVDVIFEGKPKDLPVGAMSQAARLLRPKLSEFDVGSFPLMSFISKSDAKIASST